MSPTSVFVSATSHDLRSYRHIVSEWARGKGYTVVVQDEFPVQSDYATIVQMLRDKLAPCGAVIHLAGHYYGHEPQNTPAGEQRRSYTQLEYELGKELKRQVFRFLARADYQPDNPLAQTDELRDLQQQHRARLMQGNELCSSTSRTTGNELYYEFSTPDELRQRLDNIEIRTRVAKPNNLPTGRIGTLFKGREDFLQQLRQVLVNKPTHIAAVTGKQAIHGLGGVGKTRTAIEYAWQHEHEYTALLFITADSAASLSNNLANLCGALVLDLPEQTAKEKEVQVAAALRWLQEHAGWLLIVDNVDTEEAQAEVERLLHKITSGHVIVTSRLARWRHGVTSLALDVLSNDAAKEFLLERTANERRVTPTDDQEATLLAQALDGLALALEQAGAYIAVHRLRIADYRARWQKQDAKVLEWFDVNEMHYPRSIATTWQTSIDALGNDGRALLNILCWLAPDPIPREMIEGVNEGEEYPAIDVESGLADLTRYSLAAWENNNDSIQMHRLVLDVAGFRMNHSQQNIEFSRALRMLDRFFPKESEDVLSWSICLTAAPHVVVATKTSEKFGNPTPTAHLLNRFALYLHNRADFADAEPLIRRALMIHEQLLGPSHTNVASSLGNLASVLQATNRLAEAEPLKRRALAIDEQVFGPNHPEVAVHLNNLAQLLDATNRLAEAEPLMRRALQIDEQNFGPDHPKVAIRLNNLAQLLKDTERLSEAEPLMRRTLFIAEKSLGPNHPHVAISLNNLGSLLIETGRLAEAEPLMRRALEIDEHSVGPNHPKIATRLNNLAQLYKATGMSNDAEVLTRRAIEINERCYGPNHPRVAAGLNNLSRLLHDLDRMDEAEPIMRRALAIDEQSFGPDHPEVAIDLVNLALQLCETDRLEEAKAAMLRARAIFVKSFGPDNSRVALCNRHLNHIEKLSNLAN